ncbi:MAG: hypothetical protein Q9170_007869 [Blastenia crenularia]
MHTTHLDSRSWATTLLQFLIRPFRPLLVKPGKPLPSGSPRITPLSKIRSRCHIEEKQINGIWTYTLSAKKSPPQDQNTKQDENSPKTDRIYYFAGGAFQMPPSPQHWTFCAEICNRCTNTNVTVVSYPLAPNNPAPDSFPKLVELFHSLMHMAKESGETATFMGDSAGGNLALSVPLYALSQVQQRYRLRGGDEEREGGIPLTSIFLISPTLSLLNTNPQIPVTAKHDPVLTIPYINSVAETWAGGWALGDPRLSPLVADISVLKNYGVRVYGVTGSYDILAPDAEVFRERCEKEGVEGQWLSWERQMHCFPLAWGYGFKESRRGLEWVVEMLRREAEGGNEVS